MPDYRFGMIYSIRFHDNDKLIYIGSTIQPLYKRFSSHKNETTIQSYVMTHYNGDWTCCHIELIEKFPCSCRKELETREWEIIRDYKANPDFILLNKAKLKSAPFANKSKDPNIHEAMKAKHEGKYKSFGEAYISMFGNDKQVINIQPFHYSFLTQDEIAFLEKFEGLKLKKS